MNSGFNKLLEAVVRIDVREVAFEEGAKRYVAAVGSGVILSKDGLILTNAHVVSPRAIEINITLASLERVGATLVGWDHWTDLAVIRLNLDEVKKRDLKFTYADFGDSDALYPGETVYAVGTPHGLTRTVTRGIISNNRRYFQDNSGVRGYETGAFNTWLQTDAAINPGNSGGPLVTEDGAVIGITSRGYLGANNLGFAIPGNIAKRVSAALAQDGSITRSYLGIVPRSLQDLENFFSLALNTGMLIDSVDPESPAAKAGLRAGDILLTLNGVTEKLESRIGEEWAFEKWGLSVRKVSRAYAREKRLENADGVIVIGTQSGFPAEVAGLGRDDIITKVNQQPLTDLDMLKKLYATFETKPESLLIEAQRNHRISLYVLKP